MLGILKLFEELIMENQESTSTIGDRIGMLRLRLIESNGGEKVSFSDQVVNAAILRSLQQKEGGE